MKRLRRNETAHRPLHWTLVVLLLLIAGLLMPVNALAQHHSSGHHGGYGGHGGYSRYSFGFSHGGHGVRYGHHGGGHRFSLGYFGGRHSYGGHRGADRRYGRSYRSGRSYSSPYVARSRSYATHDGDGYRSSERAYDGDCEPVHKRAEVDGRPATIEGRRCYDEHGEAYIVPESRRIVEYHDGDDDDYRR
ncbi:MAG: hypothetical protein RQ741_02205 [Wenzhouxiangellaceae bacterium]|nr:hypothetical protein [Wenzhouxiangellaceae bacterium]